MSGESEETKRPEKGSDAGVLAALPSRRPNRLGRPRDGAKPAAPKNGVVEGAAAPKNGTVKGATAKKAAAAKRDAKPAAAPKAPAPEKPARAKPKAAAPDKPAPAEPKAAAPEQPADIAPASRPAREPATPRRPRAVRSGAPALDPHAEAAARREPSEAEKREQGGAEIVATVVQAAGELAQIGLTVGSQLIKRAVERLPKR